MLNLQRSLHYKNVLTCKMGWAAGAPVLQRSVFLSTMMAEAALQKRVRMKNGVGGGGAILQPSSLPTDFYSGANISKT
jgi:hypothetical protein